MDKKVSKSYLAKIGCWNCSEEYNISVKKGIVTPIHLVNKKLKCRKCGCDSLRAFDEYKINKEIAKDLVLQAKLEETMITDDHISHDHYK